MLQGELYIAPEIVEDLCLQLDIIYKPRLCHRNICIGYLRILSKVLWQLPSIFCFLYRAHTVITQDVNAIPFCDIASLILLALPVVRAWHAVWDLRIRAHIVGTTIHRAHLVVFALGICTAWRIAIFQEIQVFSHQLQRCRTTSLNAAK
jgi:hypothetical protein